MCHEMQNPLNSIIHSSESIKTLLVDLKEFAKGLAGDAQSLLINIVEDMQSKSKMQNSSTKLLKFFVRDLLDFQSIKHKKLKKDIETFNVKDAIEEVIDVMRY